MDIHKDIKQDWNHSIIRWNTDEERILWLSDIWHKTIEETISLIVAAFPKVKDRLNVYL
jgi:hypothetical protein